jgi:hypothetical protein
MKHLVLFENFSLNEDVISSKFTPEFISTPAGLEEFVKWITSGTFDRGYGILKTWIKKYPDAEETQDSWDQTWNKVRNMFFDHFIDYMKVQTPADKKRLERALLRKGITMFKGDREQQLKMIDDKIKDLEAIIKDVEEQLEIYNGMRTLVSTT